METTVVAGRPIVAIPTATEIVAAFVSLGGAAVRTALAAISTPLIVGTYLAAWFTGFIKLFVTG